MFQLCTNGLLTDCLWQGNLQSYKIKDFLHLTVETDWKSCFLKQAHKFFITITVWINSQPLGVIYNCSFETFSFFEAREKKRGLASIITISCPSARPSFHWSIFLVANQQNKVLDIKLSVLLFSTTYSLTNNFHSMLNAPKKYFFVGPCLSLPTAFPFNSNVYTPKAIRSYIHSLLHSGNQMLPKKYVKFHPTYILMLKFCCSNSTVKNLTGLVFYEWFSFQPKSSLGPDLPK